MKKEMKLSEKVAANSTGFSYQIPISRTFTKDGKMFLEGTASSTSQDDHGTIFNQQCQEGFVSDINDGIKDGEPVFCESEHMGDESPLFELGWVVEGELSENLTRVLVELDQDNPNAIYYWNKFNKGDTKRKEQTKWGLSVNGWVQDSHFNSSGIREFDRVKLRKVGIVRQPSNPDSYIDNIVRSVSPEDEISESKNVVIVKKENRMSKVKVERGMLLDYVNSLVTQDSQEKIYDALSTATRLAQNMLGWVQYYDDPAAKAQEVMDDFNAVVKEVLSNGDTTSILAEMQEDYEEAQSYYDEYRSKENTMPVKEQVNGKEEATRSEAETNGQDAQETTPEATKEKVTEDAKEVTATEDSGSDDKQPESTETTVAKVDETSETETATEVAKVESSLVEVVEVLQQSKVAEVVAESEKTVEVVEKSTAITLDQVQEMVTRALADATKVYKDEIE